MTLKIFWFILLPWAGILSPHQLDQSPIQTDLEHFQGWPIHSFSGKLCPMTFQPHHDQLLPQVLTKPTLFLFKVIAPSPVIMNLGKKTLILISSLYVLGGYVRFTWSCLFPRMKIPSFVLIKEIFQPSDFCGSSLDPLYNTSMSVFC